MKRRKFIVKSAIGGMVLGFIPAHLFSTSRREQEMFSFPETSEQIRHGIYSPTIKNHIHVDEFLTYLEKHIFFKNGFEKGKDDLINLSFRHEDKLHSFSWVSEKIHYQNEEHYSEVNRLIELSNTRPNISAIQLKGKLKLNIDNDMIVIPLDGECLANGATLNEQNGSIIKTKELLLEANKEVKLILITRNYE